MPEAPNLVRLTEFSELLPLAPGDLVGVTDDGVATDVHPADGLLARVIFEPDADQDVVEATGRIWSRATTVQVGYRVAAILTNTREWIDDAIAPHPLVAVVEIEREPGAELDLAAAIRAEVGDDD